MHVSTPLEEPDIIEVPSWKDETRQMHYRAQPSEDRTGLEVQLAHVFVCVCLCVFVFVCHKGGLSCSADCRQERHQGGLVRKHGAFSPLRFRTTIVTSNGTL